MRSAPRQSVGVLIATCATLAIPVLVDIAHDPRVRPFGYVAADTFYYLSVGRNIVDLGLVSMDGQHPTNGFHPLWQAIVAILYGSCRLVHAPTWNILVVVL